MNDSRTPDPAGPEGLPSAPRDDLTAAFDKIQTLLSSPLETALYGFTDLEEELYKLRERIEALEAAVGVTR